MDGFPWVPLKALPKDGALKREPKATNVTRRSKVDKPSLGGNDHAHSEEDGLEACPTSPASLTMAFLRSEVMGESVRQ